MDNNKKLELAKKQNEKKIDGEKLQKTFDSFIADLDRLLTCHITVEPSDDLDRISDRLEKYGAETVGLVGRITELLSSLDAIDGLKLEIAEPDFLSKLEKIETIANVEIPAELTSKFISLEKAIGELTKATDRPQSKLPEDYTPVRIVVGDNGSLEYMRNFPLPVFTGGGNGGGGGSVTVTNFPDEYPLPSSQVQTDALTDAQLRASPIPVAASIDTTGLATEAKQDDIITAIGNIGGADEATRIAVDSVDDEITYIGKAPIGTADDDNSWKIKRLDSSSIDLDVRWADAGEYTQVWDDREVIVYA